MRFVELPYVLATEEAERIGVDHVARLSSNDSGEASTGNAQFYNFIICGCSLNLAVKHFKKYSPMTTIYKCLAAQHLMAQYNAVKMLHSRVTLILEYVKAMENGSSWIISFNLWKFDILIFCKDWWPKTTKF